MIERILNNYFQKKLINRLKFSLLIYYLDFKYIFTKNKISVQCKRKKYNDEEYVNVFKIDKEDCYYYLCNYEKFIANVKKLINDYYKEEK